MSFQDLFKKQKEEKPSNGETVKKYRYVARNIKGEKVKGEGFAKNIDDLREKLAYNDIFLSKAKEVKPSPFIGLFGASAREIATFCSNFAVMYSSKIPIDSCLLKLKNSGLFSSNFTYILDAMYVDVRSGYALYEAMDKHKRVFPSFFRAMVRVGEQSNSLDKILLQLSDFYAFNNEMKSKTKSALIYPALLVVMILGVVGIMVFFVIPTFMRAFESMEIVMPALTMAVFNISRFFLDNWQPILIISLIVIVILFIFFGFTDAGKITSGWLAIHVPIIKRITLNSLSAKFARAVSLMLSSKLSLVETLEVTQEVLGNRIYQIQMSKVINDVKYNGERLSDSLKKYRLFGLVLPEIVSCGEESENISGVLAGCWEHYYHETQRAIETATTLFQPILLVTMGAIIGIMFLAVYSPVLAMIEQLLQHR